MTNQPLNEVALEIAFTEWDKCDWPAWEDTVKAIQAYLAATNVQKRPENEHSLYTCSNDGYRKPQVCIHEDTNKRLREAAKTADFRTECSMGAMQIAEGDEGWEKISIDCPMMLAVADLRRRYDKLRDAVIILPDDAEPEVGDLVYLTVDGHITFHYYGELKREPNFFSKYGIFPIVRSDITEGVPKYKIIQRNGKPVIYESALATDKTE